MGRWISLLLACRYIAVTSVLHPAFPPARPVPPIVVELDPKSLGKGTAAWLPSIEARFPRGCVVVSAHGTYDEVGDWVTDPEMPLETSSVRYALVPVLRMAHPKLPIVLLVCNGRGVDVGEPNVFYAKGIVANYPDCSDDTSHVGRLELFLEGGTPRSSGGNGRPGPAQKTKPPQAAAQAQGAGAP